MLKHFTALNAARTYHAECGGWLLDDGDGEYTVTDDSGIVIDLRGKEWIARCEAQKCWDETELPA